jgi:peptidoglycan hydrolase-like protein with peptidoglycan-binding domain
VAHLTLSLGDGGPAVVALKLGLAALGFGTDTFNETFDEDTVSVVKDFQINQGLADTGVVDDETWTALSSQAFHPDERVQVSATDSPSVARAVFFGADIDSYLQDLGIDASSIVDDEQPIV